MFLPINSIEKYLYNVCTDSTYKNIKRKINDTFFNVESIDDILADYVQDNDNNGKALYRKILGNLEKRNISEDAFIKELCNIIMNAINFEPFASELQTKISY